MARGKSFTLCPRQYPHLPTANGHFREGDLDCNRGEEFDPPHTHTHPYLYQDSSPDWALPIWLLDQQEKEAKSSSLPSSVAHQDGYKIEGIYLFLFLSSRHRTTKELLGTFSP